MRSIYTIRPIATKGTDAFLHELKKHNPLRGKAEKHNCLLYFWDASTTVTPNAMLSGTLLKGK